MHGRSIGAADIAGYVIAFIGIFIVFLLLSMIFALPSIWALNVLFGLSIPYSLKTAFAMAWIISAIKTTSSGNSK